MTVALNLRIVGVLLTLLGISHAFFNRHFKWEQELAAVSLFTRRVFFVHTFFIALGVVLAGAGSFLLADSVNAAGETLLFSYRSCALFSDTNPTAAVANAMQCARRGQKVSLEPCFQVSEREGIQTIGLRKSDSTGFEPVPPPVL